MLAPPFPIIFLWNSLKTCTSALKLLADWKPYPRIWKINLIGIFSHKCKLLHTTQQCYKSKLCWFIQMESIDLLVSHLIQVMFVKCPQLWLLPLSQRYENCLENNNYNNNKMQVQYLFLQITFSSKHNLLIYCKCACVCMLECYKHKYSKCIYFIILSSQVIYNLGNY